MLYVISSSLEYDYKLNNRIDLKVLAGKPLRIVNKIALYFKENRSNSFLEFFLQALAPHLLVVPYNMIEVNKIIYQMKG